MVGSLFVSVKRDNGVWPTLTPDDLASRAGTQDAAGPRTLPILPAYPMVGRREASWPFDPLVDGCRPEHVPTDNTINRRASRLHTIRKSWVTW